MFLFTYARFVVITVMEGPLDICSGQILQKNMKELPTSSTNSSQIQQVGYTYAIHQYNTSGDDEPIEKSQ